MTIEREKGAAGVDCPTCGTTLGVSAQPDGSTAADTCPKCYGGTPAPAPVEPEKAAAVPDREVGTFIEED